MTMNYFLKDEVAREGNLHALRNRCKLLQDLIMCGEEDIMSQSLRDFKKMESLLHMEIGDRDDVVKHIHNILVGVVKEGNLNMLLSLEGGEGDTAV